MKKKQIYAAKWRYLFSLNFRYISWICLIRLPLKIEIKLKIWMNDTQKQLFNLVMHYLRNIKFVC